MAKPSITKRVTKGAALTYSELDSNFQNLKDATITLTAGTAGTNVTADLNGTITLVAGTNITLTGNNTTKEITIDATAAGGSGTINTGVGTSLAYYPSNGTTIDDIAINYYTSTGIQGLQNTGTNTFQLSNVNGTTYLNLNNDGSIGVVSDNIRLGQNDSDEIFIRPNASASSKNINIISNWGGGNGASVAIGVDVSLSTADGYNNQNPALVLPNGLRILGLSSAPSSTFLNNGCLYFNTTSQTLEFRANSTWQTLLTSTNTMTSSNASGSATIDRSGVTAAYANNATLDFANFSGMVMINRQDAGSGNVSLWLCGSGTAVKLGDSNGDSSGTIAANAGINGYRWTNNTGGTITCSFMTFKGRAGG